MRVRIALSFALLGTLAAASAAHAQDWRTLQSARQLHDTGEYDVRVKYAAGHLELERAEAPFLYQMHLRYDAEHATALHSLREGRVLTLGVERTTSFVRTGRTADENRMTLALSPAVPIDLSLELGAVEAKLDLGGLSLKSLEIAAGANDTRIDFRTANRVPMRALDVKTGASSVVITNIANANAATLRVASGVGSLELDFRGAWTNDLAASVDMALGTLRLIVPNDVGVRLEIGKVLARVKTEGLSSRGGALVSDNWDSARYQLTVRAKTVVGSIEVERVAP